jgi:putative transport protein
MNKGELLEFLRGQPVITLFVALGCGYVLGRIRVAGLSLGAVAGTLLISLVLGRFGFRISPAAQAVGFSMFMFAVGYQAGPRFLEVLKANGLRYFALSLVVVAIGFVTALVAGKLLALPPGGTAGLLAGALTTTPALAAAQEAVRSGAAGIPAGAAEQVIETIGTSYAITYTVGMIGLIAAINLLPRLAGVDLAAEARELEAASRGDRPVQLQSRAYRVANLAACSAAIGELAARYWDGLAVVRLRRDGEWVPIEHADHLRIGDEIHAYGDANLFRRGFEQLGEEIPLHRDVDFSASATRVVVARRAAIGRTLGELALARTHGVIIVEVRRDSLALPLTRDLRLARGDVLSALVPLEGVDALESVVGPVEQNAAETDMTAFTFGIAIGTAIGLLSIEIAGIPIGLGAAGGLLAAGIVVGWFSSLRPTIGKFPEAARWILMEFGLLVFICGVGLKAGGQIVEAFQQTGVPLLIAAVFVVTLPVIGGYAFARRVLGLSPVMAMGALTGAMTSSPALSLITGQAKSAIPALGYTGTYAFANIFLTISGTLMMLL